MLIEKMLAKLDFEQTHIVDGQPSITHLFKPEQRCGIYILHFANGEFYAGKTKDVCKRYLQHIKNYDDIVSISFKCVPFEKLDVEEEWIIKNLEKEDFHLRNVIHASFTYAPSPFDDIMALPNQERWRVDLEFNDFTGIRIENPDFRMKYRKRYETFSNLVYSDQIILFLKEYVKRAIPAPIKSEAYYWSSSCLPGNSASLRVRINIYQPEVLAIRVVEDEIWFQWQVAKSPLKKTWRKHWITLKLLSYNGSEFDGNGYIYPSGGQDQIRLVVPGIENALNLLRDKDFLCAIRLFNLRLMQKGTNTHFRSHCFDLADQILQ
jgi:hypothetical protein